MDRHDHDPVAGRAGFGPCASWIRAYRDRVSRAALVVVGVLCCAASGGAWWLVSAGWPSWTQSSDPTDAETPPAVKQSAVPWAPWTVTEQLVAGSVLVLQIETTHLDDALTIARQLVEPTEARYAEVMIYFHRPGRPQTLPPGACNGARAGGTWRRITNADRGSGLGSRGPGAFDSCEEPHITRRERGCVASPPVSTKPETRAPGPEPRP